MDYAQGLVLVVLLRHPYGMTDENLHLLVAAYELALLEKPWLHSFVRLSFEERLDATAGRIHSDDLVFVLDQMIDDKVVERSRTILGSLPTYRLTKDGRNKAKRLTRLQKHLPRMALSERLVADVAERVGLLTPEKVAVCFQAASCKRFREELAEAIP